MRSAKHPARWPDAAAPVGPLVASREELAPVKSSASRRIAAATYTWCVVDLPDQKGGRLIQVDVWNQCMD